MLLAQVVFEGERPIARLGVLLPEDGRWTYSDVDDNDSNVLHKAMVLQLPGQPPAILTAGGSRAILKLWRNRLQSAILVEANFGGEFSRMRDVEVADIYGDGMPCLVVATHDQGVVLIGRPLPDGRFEVRELDRSASSIVHEVEVGDVDGDGVREIYAASSTPNRFDGTLQPGKVVRYIPALGRGRDVVADLGEAHAKEILVTDADRDGLDELYVVVEDAPRHPACILRYDADTDPKAGIEVATLPDLMCRSLVAGDVNNDHRIELVAATFKGGLWLLHQSQPGAPWEPILIDPESGGIEHASLVADLDGDGTDELYSANDAGSTVDRYVWIDGRPQKTVLYAYPQRLVGFTWNVMPVPVALARQFLE